LYLYFQIRALDSKNLYLSGISGAVFALCVLVRPTLFPLLFLPYLLKWWQTKDKHVFLEFGVFLLGIIIVMLPWWIRNVITMGEFILLCTQSGNPLLGGTFPYFEGFDGYVLTHATETEAAIFRIIEGLKTQPWLYIKWFTIGKFNVIFYNIWYYLPGATGAVSVRYFHDSFNIIHYSIVTLGWIGTIFGMFFKKIRFVSLFAILFTCLHLMFIPTERYAITIIPMLIICASFMISRLKVKL
jgi:hypothetical protein